MPAFWHGDNLNVGAYLNPYSRLHVKGLVPKMVGMLHITQPLQWCLAVPAATHAKRVLLLTKETVVVKHALAMQLTTYLHVQ